MNPYQVFFNVYKPVTKYKKTNPPPPDFRIGAIRCVNLVNIHTYEAEIHSLPFSAQTTAIPDLWDFENIFAELDETPPSITSVEDLQSTLKSVWSYLTSYFHPSSASSAVNSSSNKGNNKNISSRPRKPVSNSLTRPAPYAKLKNGSKSAIIAVVDNGTISFQRFGQSGFEELPWVGGDA